MNYSDLTGEQRLEFKQRILMERNEARGEGTSYNELADADTLVSDEDAEFHAEGVEFSPDDFSCGVAAEGRRTKGDEYGQIHYAGGRRER